MLDEILGLIKILDRGDVRQKEVRELDDGTVVIDYGRQYSVCINCGAKIDAEFDEFGCEDCVDRDAPSVIEPDQGRNY